MALAKSTHSYQELLGQMKFASSLIAKNVTCKGIFSISQLLSKDYPLSFFLV